VDLYLLYFTYNYHAYYMPLPSHQTVIGCEGRNCVEEACNDRLSGATATYIYWLIPQVFRKVSKMLASKFSTVDHLVSHVLQIKMHNSKYLKRILSYVFLLPC
jgi:hypothetical protein